MSKKSRKVNVADLPYRPGVGLMLINDARQVFVARRIDTAEDAWQMPQGGIDEGENPEEAALRELKEEIGTDNAEIIAASAEWVTYDLPVYLVSKVWKGRYRGQKQKWFLLRFKGSDDEIDLESHNPEFSHWKWADLDTLIESIVPFKRDVYRKVVEEFTPAIATLEGV
jgi:putative (di)nucleoside polyphosphate hydrolase